MMRNADLGLSSGVANAIKLITTVRAVAGPAINRIEAGYRNVRRISGRGGFGCGERGEAGWNCARSAIIIRRRAVAPRARPRDARAGIVQNDLIGLMTERAEGDHGCAGVEAVVGEKVQLVEVA